MLLSPEKASCRPLHDGWLQVRPSRGDFFFLDLHLQQSDVDRLLNLSHAGLYRTAPCRAASQQIAIQTFIEQTPLLAQQSDTLFSVGQQADLLVQQQLTGDAFNGLHPASCLLLFMGTQHTLRSQ